MAATEIDFKKGDVVRYIDSDGSHDENPRWFPADGTIGTVLVSALKEHIDWPYVQWPSRSTSDDDCWFCPPRYLELVKKGGEDDGE